MPEPGTFSKTPRGFFLIAFSPFAVSISLDAFFSFCQLDRIGSCSLSPAVHSCSRSDHSGADRIAFGSADKFATAFRQYHKRTNPILPTIANRLGTHAETHRRDQASK